jgi:hypothetical protein
MDEQNYAAHLEALTDEDLTREVFEQIDRANQSPTFSSADARARQCYDEAVRRGDVDLYQRSFEAAYAAAKGDQHYHRAMQLLGTAG